MSCRAVDMQAIEVFTTGKAGDIRTFGVATAPYKAWADKKVPWTAVDTSGGVMFGAGPIFELKPKRGYQRLCFTKAVLTRLVSLNVTSNCAGSHWTTHAGAGPTHARPV